MTASGDKGQKKHSVRPVLRDYQILEAIHTARYLTTEQIQRLFWTDTRGGKGEWGRVKACQQRLRLLCDNGFVRRIQLPIRRGDKPQPYIYALDSKGAELLTSELGIEPQEIDWRPKAHEEHFPFMEHLLTTTDFRIALMQATRQTGVTLDEWLDEKALKADHNVDYVTLVGPSGGATKAAVVPDAFFVLERQGKRGIFFVEVDLKSVTIAPSIWERRGWMRRIRTYEAYFRSETYHTKYKGRRARVLTITSSKTRLDNLKAATETVFEQLHNAGEGSSSQDCFWFTLFGTKANPVHLLTEPVWLVAGSDTSRVLLG